MARLLPRTTHADHPLLAQVAHQACRATHAAAAAITRAPCDAEAEHAVIARSGELELLEDVEPLGPDDFPPGVPVVAYRDGIVGLLPISAEAYGTLVILRPKWRPGDVLREELDSLVVLAAEALRAAEAERDLALTLDASVQSLAALLDLRDGYTGQHSSTVVRLCEEVGRRVGVAGAELEHLRIAAHLHDLGKIGVPDQILHKPGPLDAAEWSIMREHPVWGARALEQIPGFRAASLAVRHHHERWDGQGYPDGLAGERIPLGARVIAVCDAYEAMTSTRPYRPAIAEQLARERIVAGTGTQFDPAVTWGLLGALAAR
jgi:HD-GYP domain-containing protein (c-di-GMP phosphodiesterase class II)